MIKSKVKKYHSKQHVAWCSIVSPVHGFLKDCPFQCPHLYQRPSVHLLLQWKLHLMSLYTEIHLLFGWSVVTAIQKVSFGEDTILLIEAGLPSSGRLCVLHQNLVNPSFIHVHYLTVNNVFRNSNIIHISFSWSFFYYMVLLCVFYSFHWSLCISFSINTAQL